MINTPSIAHSYYDNLYCFWEHIINLKSNSKVYKTLIIFKLYINSSLANSVMNVFYMVSGSPKKKVLSNIFKMACMNHKMFGTSVITVCYKMSSLLKTTFHEQNYAANIKDKVCACGRWVTSGIRKTFKELYNDATIFRILAQFCIIHRITKFTILAQNSQFLTHC